MIKLFYVLKMLSVMFLFVIHLSVYKHPNTFQLIDLRMASEIHLVIQIIRISYVNLREHYPLKQIIIMMEEIVMELIEINLLI